MNNIKFRKDCTGRLMVNDIVNKFDIDHLYFVFNEKNFPFDSRMLLQYLVDRRISVVSIGDNVKNKDFFLPYLIQDEVIVEQDKKKEEDRIKAELDAEERVKQDLIKAEKDKKKREKDEVKAKIEKDKKVKIIDQTNIASKIKI